MCRCPVRKPFYIAIGQLRWFLPDAYGTSTDAHHHQLLQGCRPTGNYSILETRAFPRTDLGQTSRTPVSGAADPLRAQLNCRRRQSSTRFLYRLRTRRLQCTSYRIGILVQELKNWFAFQIEPKKERSCDRQRSFHACSALLASAPWRLQFLHRRLLRRTQQ